MSIHPRPSRTLPSFRLNPCTAALLLALGGGGALLSPLPSHAQTAAVPTAGAEAMRDYDLPAGPLAGTLNRIAREAGLALTVDAQLVEGRSAAPVRGRLNAPQALRQALAGSGLELLATTGGGYTLRVAAAPAPAAASGGGAPATLSTVTVTAVAERGNGSTEGTGSYRATASNTATKLTLTPRETPQTVTVVTSQQMQDFGMTSVDDALKAVSGAFVGDRGIEGSLYFSRGFRMQSQYDGAPNPAGLSEGNRNPQIDNAFFDRVEVLQGAAGLLAGAGTPGGTINLVRKRPTETFQAQVEAQLSSWDGRRIVGDVSGPLNESGRVRGRLVAVADNSESFVDHAYRNRRAVYGVVEADLTPTTTLDASVQYQQDTGRIHFGAPFAADGSEPGIRRSAFFGDGRSRNVKDYTLVTLGLTQRLGGDWQAKAAFTHGKTGGDQRHYSYLLGELDAATGDGLELNRMPNFWRDLETHTIDAHATGPFDLLGRRHEAAFGLNGSSMRDKFQSFDYTAIDAVNVFAFDPLSLGDVPPTSNSYSSDSKITQLGAYGVARFSLSDAIKLITGARVSNYKDENSWGATKKETGVISPYAGLVYDLGPQASIYASYSDIFNPQSNKSADGATLKPVTGSNYEAGIKGELLDKRLNVAAAVFRLEQANLPRRDTSVPYDPTNACGGTCYIAADKVVSQGVDLSANGEMATDWNVAAGYTFVDSKYVSGLNDGQRYNTYLPRHSLRLSTAYKLPGTGWTLGGSLTARNKVYLEDTSWTTGDPYTIRSGGLMLVGLMAKYEINPKAELTMTVSNLFDRTYRAYLETKYHSNFGEPRRVAVNLKYQF